MKNYLLQKYWQVRDISNFDEKIINLMQQRNLYNFKIGHAICFYHEKVYHTRYEALQLYCFGLHIPESAIAITLKMKPGQKLCLNCMKLYQEKLKFANLVTMIKMMAI